jgi:hypothetical protein
MGVGLRVSPHFFVWLRFKTIMPWVLHGGKPNLSHYAMNASNIPIFEAAWNKQTKAPLHKLYISNACFAKYYKVDGIANGLYGTFEPCKFKPKGS